MRRNNRLPGREKSLGITSDITRRDFLGTMLLGMGAALLEFPAPIQVLALTESWFGYGGTGDYKGSHGNTEEVIRVFERIQKGKYDQIPSEVIDTGEIFDLLIVGGGLSGLGAAYHFKTHAQKGQSCLILENHPIFGGQAKRNEFIVDGTKLISVQASNAFVVIDRPGIPGHELFEELKVPKRFKYQPLGKGLKPLQFDRTNYGFALWHDLSPSVGYFFQDGEEGKWLRDLWGKNFERSPYAQNVRNDFLIWRTSKKRYYGDRDFKQWLDTMTYKDYIETTMGLSSQVTAFANPILASGLGLGCDAISAYGAYQISMPGFEGFTGRGRNRRLEDSDWHSFPGGNDGFSRYLVKYLIPGAIEGRNMFADILNERVNWGELDRRENDIRMRLNATVVRVEHNGEFAKSEHVVVTYIKGGKAYRLMAKGVVMAAAGWMNQRVVRDLPENIVNAYKSFRHSAVMVVNVALTNWRFLYKLGITGCRWFKGFGYTCNIRQPMTVGDYNPPFHPDKPIVMTFYIPFHYPGIDADKQGKKGRGEILSTSYYNYERQIREQMVMLFGKAGFDPRKDIAGIILNRWVYAYLNPQPGFYFGKNKKQADRDIIRQGFGRISFGHSELDGHQNWSGAFAEGQRAAEQILKAL